MLLLKISLLTYFKPKITNTTNKTEDIFYDYKKNLRNYSGLTLEKRKCLIFSFSWKMKNKLIN